MKSERRHELEQNQLAGKLAKMVESIKPYQNAILGGTLLLVIVIGGVVWSRANRASARDEGWGQVSIAQSSGIPDAADFEKIGEDYSDSMLSCQAMLAGADLRLKEGCSKRFENKKDAEDELKDAVSGYKKVIDETAGDDDLFVVWQQATFGLARARETLGELDKAKDLYETLTKDAGGAFRSQAQRRLTSLQDKDLHDRLAEYTPRPSASVGSGWPGGDPQFNMDTLDRDPSIFSIDEGEGGVGSPGGLNSILEGLGAPTTDDPPPIAPPVLGPPPAAPAIPDPAEPPAATE